MNCFFRKYFLVIQQNGKNDSVKELRENGGCNEGD
jgi:hypothetical protein